MSKPMGLAVDRMTVGELHTTLYRSLRQLDPNYLVVTTGRERFRLWNHAMLCAAELRIRGSQMTMLAQVPFADRAEIPSEGPEPLK